MLKDYTAGEFRRLAQRAKDAALARPVSDCGCAEWRLAGRTRPRLSGMDRQTLRGWVIRFNEQGADGLINGERVAEIQTVGE